MNAVGRLVSGAGTPGVDQAVGLVGADMVLVPLWSISPHQGMPDDMSRQVAAGSTGGGANASPLRGCLGGEGTSTGEKEAARGRGPWET